MKVSLRKKLEAPIKPGKSADMTLCDINLMKFDSKDVLKMNIEMTIVDGKVV